MCENMINALKLLRLHLQRWNRISTPLTTRMCKFETGAVCSDMVTAPQPLGLPGPMAQGHLTTMETRDVDLIPFPTQRMNTHEVPSYYGSRVNNTTLGLRIESSEPAERWR